MDAQTFWNVIGNYNQSTFIWQGIIFTGTIVSLCMAYFQRLVWLPKITLGIANIFIGVVFFLYFGTEPIQTYFAAPLFVLTGGLFIYEAIKNCQDRFNKPRVIQWALLVLVAIYPLVSFLLGHSFPMLVVYIMPCPIISLSIVIYSCFNRRNKVLLFLMTVWGLTGIKAFFVNAYEDIVLLVCGLFCLWLFVNEIMKRKTVIISSEFPTSTHEIWEKLQRLDTLQYIANPYAIFRPVGKTEMIWEEGHTFKFRLFLFGFFPMGVHTISVVRFNKDTLEIFTNESNKFVPVWNHRILLKKVSDNKTHYTDEVEIYARIITPIVYLWSKAFYKHRQKKWLRLLS